MNIGEAHDEMSEEERVERMARMADAAEAARDEGMPRLRPDPYWSHDRPTAPPKFRGAYPIELGPKLEQRQVIITRIGRRGSGAPDSPVRVITQIWTPEGELLGEFDPCSWVTP